MSEIKPAAEIKSAEEVMKINESMGGSYHPALYFKQERDQLRAAYEALQKENAELKEEVKILDGMCTAINEKFAQSSESNAAQAKRIEEAVSRIKDMLENDDGQAHKEARKFIESLSASKNGE